MNSDSTDLVETGEPTSFLTNLAQSIGATANAEAVFAEPVIGDGVMVVPVARVRWGCGGGGGEGTRERTQKGHGFGGGGGMVASPVGFLIVRGGDVEYHDIERTRIVLAAALTGLALGAIVGLLRARR